MRLSLSVTASVRHISVWVVFFFFFFFFKQKTAYEMRISDWSSDVCSSDLLYVRRERGPCEAARVRENMMSSLFTFILVLQALVAAVKIGRASCRERVCQYV